MGSAKASSARGNRRGSPEAIEKRRVARMFNDVLTGDGSAVGKLDGRTAKRRVRLLKELESGEAHGGRELKPLDVLTHVQELLEIGETVAAVRKVCRPRKRVAIDDGVVELVKRLHGAYRFRPEVYRFVGIDDDVLRRAGVLQVERAKKSARAGK